MEDIIDLIATDSSASDVTDKIKDILFTKAAGKIESERPDIALSMFDTSDSNDVDPQSTEEE